MKVVLVNGSRRDNGCTYIALMEVGEALKTEGIETQLIFVGKRVIAGEVDAAVDEVGEAMKDADGLVVGSPVYYASPTGEVQMVLDRLFMKYSREMLFKPAAAVTSARRAGTTATVNVLNEYFMMHQMPVVSSRYWNMVHGFTPEDVKKDLEGMQIMRMLGRNMAWLLKSIEAGKNAGVQTPAQEEVTMTNFIR